MEYLIRPMERADLEVCAQIEQSAGDPWSLAQLSEELENQLAGGASRLFVAQAPGQPVAGLAAWQLAAGEASLYTLTVAPEARRTGAGSALLRRSLEALRSEGAEVAFLEVRASNAGAIALYEQAGFAADGRRPRFYQNPTEDAVLMHRAL